MACQEFRKEVDAVYPEPMSMLHHGTLASLNVSESASSASRRLNSSRRRDNAAMPARYRTQPVTFHEIKVLAPGTTHENPSQRIRRIGREFEIISENLKFRS